MSNSFFNLIDKIKDFGTIKSPDFIAYTLPLLNQVNRFHEQNLTAQITSINQVEFNNYLQLNSKPKPIRFSSKKLFIKPILKSTLHVSEQIEEVTDLDNFSKEYDFLNIHIDNEKPLEKPIYVLNYKSWDGALDHCDPLTDIFELGQILASIAFGLDFRKEDDFKLFVNNRKRLYFLNKDLHPTLLNVIYEMTNLYREDRTTNLNEVITKLNNYREYNPENYVDLTETEGFRNQDVSDRSNWILSKLKNRLFDISRRNKLLYFTNRNNFLNLTVSSVPLLLDYKNVKEKDLIFWNDTIQKKLINNKKLILNTYLEFSQNRFLAPTINKIRLEARKSKNEYGFSQLKTVIAFLHWYNFKEDKEERITSPLLLIPTEIVKKKGVKDKYTLIYSSSEAEINPILSYYLKDLFDIQLPDFIDLETTSIDELIQSIQKQISSGATGILLEWRDKPKIQLIHSIAKKNFNLKNRKLENRSRNLNLKSFSYSYQKDDFQPLGLQIFNDRIRQKNNVLEYIINEDLNPENNAVSEKSRTFYNIDNNGEINPLIWEVDTCNITLGNFNYRKMSLVRDYNDIINKNVSNPIFKNLFNEFPKRLNIDTVEQSKLENNYPIISSDPTQTASVQFARTGESYIIQGPPGTGKSQTITNLVADYISRDKKILFVCEKRAALDVVFHRLKNRKLDELCCLIHDSQTDKKAFIQNLKVTYNNFLENNFDDNEINEERLKIISAINSEIDFITYYHKTMKSGDINPITLLEILHLTRNNKPLPSEISKVYFPSYKEWETNKNWISQWINDLQQNGFSPFISKYLFAQLSQDILKESNVKASIINKVKNSTNLLDQFIEFIDNIDANDKLTIKQWKDQFDLAIELKGLVSADKLNILDKNSDEAKELKNQILLKDEVIKNVKELSDEISFWKIKLNENDLDEAINQWEKYNKSILRFVSPSFYKLKDQINKAYDFNKHTIKPSVINVLNKLKEFYNKENELNKIISKVKKTYSLNNLEEDFIWILNIQQKPSKILKKWLLNNKIEYIQSLISFNDNFKQFLTDTNLLFGDINNETLDLLDQKLSQSEQALNSLSVFIPYIQKTPSLSNELKKCLFEKKWSIEDFDFNLAYKSLSDIYEKERPFSNIDEYQLKVSVNKINNLFDKYYNINVSSIRSKIRTKFLDTIRITESVAAQLTPDEKTAKKTYSAARRILENEFGKSMRYKSIRDLASNEANSIMTTIKPVWLMSPLSVSDTMPIDISLFDVVIFDEASQITVEEGVPALFRTKQTIIVGDEMQMPPTNFFSSINLQDEEDSEAELKIGISLDADSLLNQGSRKLASVMLGWHYRSRRESLISFSNAAFYKRSLLTIPDSVIHHKKTKKLETVTDINDVIDVNSIIDRSISFHYLENAIYDNRKNKDEANYIANMVATLLKSKVKKSIGIVAFSMQQQSEIEAALDRLAVHDEEFETLLEEEYQRVDKDSFNGLFVKNLENVQGDERDIIIMSVCYGWNKKGRMLMNFGPINRRGGEKRLNVIFSRAKENMVIVTSILSNEIKNDYNEGANYFKRFLAYAKYISDGKLHDANLILDSLSRFEDEKSEKTDPFISQLSKSLIEKGYDIATNVGQSHFKCDLAIKNKDNNKYILGILIDKKAHYKNDDIIEQYCQKPAILNAFGWKTITVYSKDWFEKPERVIERIEQVLLGKENLNIENKPILKKEEKVVDEIKKEYKPIISEDNSFDIIFERFEFVKGTSSKYWEIAIDGLSLLVKYGRIGNRPQSNIKIFKSIEKVELEKEKMINKKLSKGYIKV